ncbi:S-4TM family putative pore-forming effector [Brevundimonas sp.]|uniref:S-4TM family putative pore-forming effector n=1 Tax=Brevundimonas sp. TaxID=1871086 RepID=UPI0028A61676|nr:S-4TM family putative pore-forming effector [Brevundimonas sp.]
MIMNAIPAIQNAAPQLRLLRAQRELYARAKRILVVQLVLTIGVPVVGAVSTLMVPDLKASVAFLALSIAMLDIAVLDRFQKRLLLSAARVQEQFDCAVLDLPWNRFTVGQPLGPEAIHDAAYGYARRHGDASLMDWYPPVVGDVQLHLARLICQRTNLWYDSKVRRHYGSLLLGFALSLLVILITVGLLGGLTLTSFVLVVVAPASPFLSWAIREYHRQRDVADGLDRIRGEAEGLWDRAKAGACGPDDCAAQSREFQNAIFARRSTSAPIFSWIYWLLRPRNEDQMNVGAADLVASIKSTEP